MITNSRFPFFALAFVIWAAIAVVAASGKTENNSSARSAAELYGKYCASCHGRDGQAKTLKAKFNHARDLTNPTWQEDVGDERIFNSIMNGRNVRGNMPAFSKKLSEQEAESLVTHVRAMRK